MARRRLAILTTLLAAGTTTARTITVDNNAPADFNNIQAAINDANDGDTVEIQPGTYTGEGNRDILIFRKTVTVTGTDPNDPNIVAATIIDCNGADNAPYRGFIVSDSCRGCGGDDANSSSDSTLAGLTITNAPDGAVFCTTPNFTVRNCTLTNNSARDGGAIYCLGENPTITNCTITANSAANDGGAIYCSGSNPVITNCTITGNFASEGGAIYCRQSNAVITGCTISGNQCMGGRAGSRGGGIYYSYGSLIITNCTLSDNRAIDYGSGGGIYIYGSNLIIGNCIFTGNSAYSGGAIRYQNSDVHITNCTFAGNSTSDVGGAIYNDSSDTTITNSTFAGNSADSGGAIAGSWNTSTVSNSIFWSNKPSDIYTSDGTPTITYCNIREGFAGLANIDLDPLFVDPGYWDSNGTPTDLDDDFWVDGDYHLKSQGWRWDTQRGVWTWDDVTSRCIDAGDPNSPLGDELLTIPADPNGQWGQNIRINMGAFGGTALASIPPNVWAIPTDYNNDGIANFTDFALWSENYGYEAAEPPAEPNAAPTLNAADLALLADRWLDQTTWFGTLLPPLAAWDPDPPDGAIGADIHPMLTWQSGVGATSHDVYFGHANPPEFQANQTETTFYPDYLSQETTYYWRIDEVNPDGTTPGSLWSFTTGIPTR